MIQLHPIPEAHHTCPYCEIHLDPIGWYIPGMRSLARLLCSKCNLDFYGDLPAGHGLNYPMLLEIETGQVFDNFDVEWFATWLSDSYANRVDAPVDFITENFRPIKRPILLNCLDTLYGHSLLKILNAQYYLDGCPDYELIILIPRFLRWMVPEGVAEIWTVDLLLKRGAEWNDWLASEVERRVKRFEQCWQSVSFSHPHPDDFAIERFTGVRPFPLNEWVERMKTPCVTFIWREDRHWCSANRYKRWHGLPKRVWRKLLRMEWSKIHVDEQRERVIVLASALREAFPQIDFAVAGIGSSGNFPDWITDLRTLEISEDIEKNWCKRYAQSHVVIGVHGSNMLLPSAHAGAVIELVPNNRWGNLIQDLLLLSQDIREILYRYRLLPINTPPEIVTKVLVVLLKHFPFVMLNFERPWCDHKVVRSNPRLIMDKRLHIKKRLTEL